MTSPATQAPCPACGYNGAGFYQSATHPCAESFHRTGRWKKPAPPSQRAELLTQGLESAIAWLHALADPHDDSIDQVHKSCAAALLQHIAALQSQLDTAQKDNLARHRQCGELRKEVAALTQRVEAADKLASVAIHNHSLFYCGKGKCGICNALEAYRALSQEPR